MKIESIRAAVAAELANRSLAGTFGLIALLLPAAVLAQGVPAEQDVVIAASVATGPQAEPGVIELDEVAVTGSRITRDGYEAPTPLTIIGIEDIEKSADSNLLVALGSLPALSGSQTNGVSHGRQGESLGGVQAINLRSLGSNRVLVLLDGVRMSPASYTNFVDVSTVPSQLISRVDVVTGGASAVYGSDAVAGVVNFVLDRKFTGLKAEVSGGMTNYDDGENYKINLSSGFGFAGDRGHVLLSGGLMDSDGTHGTDGDRKWNREGWGLITNPNYTATNGQPQTLFVPQIASSNTTAGGIVTNGPLKGTAFGPGGTPYQFQYGPILGSTAMVGGDWEANSTKFFDDMDPANSGYNIFGRIGFDLTQSINVFGQYSYGVNKVEGPFAPACRATTTWSGATMPTCRPRYATRWSRRTSRTSSSAAGTRDMPKGPYSNRRSMTRATGGLEGSFSLFDSMWNWNATYAYGRADIELHNKSIIISRTKQALDAVLDGNGNVVCRSTLTSPGDGCIPWNFMGIGVNDANLAAGAFEYLTDGGNGSTAPSSRPPRRPRSAANRSRSGRDRSRWRRASSIASTRSTPGWITGRQTACARGSNYAPLKGSQSVTEGALEAIVPLAKGVSWAKSGI